MKPMKRNLNELSKQLSKSVKSHAKSALTLGKESKKLTKASQSHSKQVNRLKRMSKRASYTNLTKLANKRNEEKKPGMATYAPAALGALGAGATLERYRRSDARKYAREARFGLPTLDKGLKGAAEELAASREELMAMEEYLPRALPEQKKKISSGIESMRKDIGNLSEAQSNLHDLKNALLESIEVGEGSRNKHLLGGAALLGLGASATALMRNRNKRKQER